MEAIKEAIQKIEHTLKSVDDVKERLKKDLEEGKSTLEIFERVQQLRKFSGQSNQEIVDLLLFTFETHKNTKKDG